MVFGNKPRARKHRTTRSRLEPQLPSPDTAINYPTEQIISVHHIVAVIDNTKNELNELFARAPVTDLPPDVLGELQSILRLHSTDPPELSYKWESYTMKMGTDHTKLDLTTARAFKKDLQEMLERGSRGKPHGSADKRKAHATPRSATKGDDVFGMYVRDGDATGMC